MARMDANGEAEVLLALFAPFAAAIPFGSVERERNVGGMKTP